MPNLVISNTCGSHYTYRSPIGDMPVGSSKTISVTASQLNDLSDLLTTEAAAGHISYNVQSVASLDTDAQYATVADTGHAARHEDGGTDEISVAALSGLLADGQTPLTHDTSHENGGGDEISVLGLSGLLADVQTPLAHAAAHKAAGADPLNRMHMVFGCDGAPVDTQYALPGYVGISATEVRARIPAAMTLKEVRVWCGIAPGGAVVDTYTVLVNGVASAAAPTVTGAAVVGTWTGSIVVTANAGISIQVGVGGGSAAQDITVLCYFEE